MPLSKRFSPIRWQNQQLHLLDQRLLPAEEVWLAYSQVNEVVTAIVDMVVRGAPAIGITAAYGMALAARQRHSEDSSAWQQNIKADLGALAASRPTAVNLFWALDRVRQLLSTLSADQDPFPEVLQLAQQIEREDAAGNLAMGGWGADLLAESHPQGCNLLTHCNAGALATGGYGTALAVVRVAWQRGLLKKVYADETRPWLQGARLTAWELMQEQIPVTLNIDAAAASLMAAGEVDWVVVGADRIAANGDVANKIGTYSLAVLARHHGVKFMVAAPLSTFDMQLACGDEIPIEARDPQEILALGGNHIAPADCPAYNPVFDVTPAELIDAIVTERGAILNPNKDRLTSLRKKPGCP